MSFGVTIKEPIFFESISFISLFFFSSPRISSFRSFIAISIESLAIVIASTTVGTPIAITLTPNVLHKWGTVTNLTLTLGSGATGVANYYMFQFTSGSTATTLSIPATVKWSGGELNIEANKTYQVSILNNCAVIGGF